MKKKLNIIYEDKNFLVVNKPSNLLTISTLKEKERTLFHEASLYVKRSNPKAKIFIVHRLDKDTSGIVLFVKNQDLKYKLQNNWNENSVRKYMAICHGNLVNKTGTIKSYLKETKTFLVYSSKDSKNGKLAITKYKVEKKNKKYSLVDIEIKTGRKNQIRVHFNDLGNSIVGDKKYNKKDKYPKLLLHAYYLRIINPINKKVMEFNCKMPTYFNDFFKED